MSRVAKSPIKVPQNVELGIEGQKVRVKGPKGELDWNAHAAVTVRQDDDGLVRIEPRHRDTQSWALAGTTRAVINNMVTGVSEGFERRLQLNGVGYRAELKENQLSLNVGLSHFVHFPLPETITAETPSQTEIVIRGIDKQLVGQLAAKIRGIRPPEPYKGKGIRYAGETVRLKEAKKK